MALIWDYDKRYLDKNANGRRLILERLINYGPVKGEKIDLAVVKKEWNRLHLFRPQKRLLELLIWGRYKSSPRSRKSFLMK